MTLTEEDAAKLLDLTMDLLRVSGAREVLDGIDESRRLGIEETLPEQNRSELKQVARTRRRPPNNVEMLHIILERLFQRLIILPNMAIAIRKRLGTGDVLWRVDTEFVSVDRIPQARLSDLSPDGFENVMAGLMGIIQSIPAPIAEHRM